MATLRNDAEYFPSTMVPTLEILFNSKQLEQTPLSLMWEITEVRGPERILQFVASCKWQVYVVNKRIVGGRTTETGWQLGVTFDEHNHEMTSNPSSYDVHKKRNPDQQKVLEQAARYCSSHLLYIRNLNYLMHKVFISSALNIAIYYAVHPVCAVQMKLPCSFYND